MTTKEMLNQNPISGNSATIEISKTEEIQVDFYELSIVHLSGKIGLNGKEEVFNFYYDNDAFRAKLDEFAGKIK